MDEDNKEKKTFKEEIEIAGSDLINRVKELIQEGNVRKLILKKDSGEVIFELPLTAGVAVGGAVALLLPVLAAIGAVAGLLARVKIEIIRTDKNNKDDEDDKDE